MSQPTPEPATATYRPPGPHDQPHPSATVAPSLAPLTWRMGNVGGTHEARAVGRLYVIGRRDDGWWWATVDGRRMADRNGQTSWGIKSHAQAACRDHVEDHRAGV